MCSMPHPPAVEPIEVTPELLQKHDKPGPRYTSYPTAPEWSESFGDPEYRAALRRAAAHGDDPLALYVHLPFCQERCLFCGCNVVISKKQEISDVYLDYLAKEIKLTVAELGTSRPVKSLHWGGGTPTYLRVDQLKQLHGMLADAFTIAPDAEIALEVDPGVTSREQLETLRELGFNRISMGVQDLDPHIQAVIARNQTEAETRELFSHCRELGFGGINIDLVYGLPEQRMETWVRTIETIIDIRPDRLAVYSYAHLPDKLKHQRKLEGFYLPTGAEKVALFAAARRLFVEAGYLPIGMDHFALPEDELSIALSERRLHRNFMGYTVVPGTDMLGLGVSSIGEIGGAYAQNVKRPVEYYKALDADCLPTMCGIKLTDDDAIRRWTIRQLMCNFHLDFAELERRFGVKYNDYFAEEESSLADFYRDEFIVRNESSIDVLPLGKIFIRNVCMVFDAYLRKPEHFNKFSRTV